MYKQKDLTAQHTFRSAVDTHWLDAAAIQHMATCWVYRPRLSSPMLGLALPIILDKLTNIWQGVASCLKWSCEH